MSLRKFAMELGVSHTLLRLWKQRKRRLSPESEKRYHKLAANTYNQSRNTFTPSSPHGPVAQFGQSIGLLIRVSWVRIPAGPPPFSA